ncbi:MAG: thiamine pyrophosphate-binding protein, partial [Opitutae bacterium]
MTSPSEQITKANFIWGHLTARCLADLGTSTVFFSPGSRSTPLIIGCENENRLACFPVLDERTAAFLALGYAKRTNLPTALICTS